MSKENILETDLINKDVATLKKLATMWGIKSPGQDKKTIVKKLSGCFADEFFVKNVCERLSPTQVRILAIIFDGKGVQTLGEIAKKMTLIPLNVEKELSVLKNYCLVYQRRNRERLTSNLDKYYIYDEIRPSLTSEGNVGGDKFRIHLEKSLPKLYVQGAAKDYLKAIDYKKEPRGASFARHALKTESLAALVESCDQLEKEILREVFFNGGVVIMNKIRNLVARRKGNFEKIIRHLEDLHLAYDIYFIEERFVRCLVLPTEVFDHLQEFPITLPPPKGSKPRSEEVSFNEFDFVLNMKKLTAFIQRKGLSLARSGKVKHSDLKRIQMSVLNLDIGLYPEKGELYQAELILPILKILELVAVKNLDIVLGEGVEEFLKEDPLELLDRLLHEIAENRDKRMIYEDVFIPQEMPFYKKEVFDECIKFITDSPGIQHNVILANLVREKILLGPGFKVKNFDSDYREMRREVISALFYLHLLGLIKVEYPKRKLHLSPIGLHYFQGSRLETENEKGGLIINPDFSIIAMPDRLSLHAIHLLKVFTELKDFDNIYNFQITKEAFQDGIMLGYDPEIFTNFLADTSRQKLPQNLIFLLEEWGRALPVVSIEDDCVVVKTSDAHQTELLLGQIKGKKIVREQLSDTALIIEKGKIFDLINHAEKLDMIVKLIR